MSPASKVPWASLCASILAFVACFLFAYCFATGIDGFIFQINTIATVAPANNINAIARTVTAYVGVIFCVFIVLFFAAAFFATSEIAKISNNEFDRPVRPLSHHLVCSRTVTVFAIILAHTVLLLWTVVFCVAAMALILYVAFFIITQEVCAVVDNQCFDLKLLVPLIKKITANKVDLMFCPEKKQAVCDNNYLGNFIIALLACLLSLLGTVYLLMCMAANYSRLSARLKARKGEHYAMNTGTVDSDSIILQTMAK